MHAFLHTWTVSLAELQLRLELGCYESGQPRLATAEGQDWVLEELTIEMPHFSLRAYDADFGFRRLHMVFRDLTHARLLEMFDVVKATTYAFYATGDRVPLLPIVYIPTPAAWLHNPEVQRIHV